MALWNSLTRSLYCISSPSSSSILLSSLTELCSYIFGCTTSGTSALFCSICSSFSACWRWRSSWFLCSTMRANSWTCCRRTAEFYIYCTMSSFWSDTHTTERESRCPESLRRFESWSITSTTRSNFLLEQWEESILKTRLDWFLLPGRE